MLCQLCNDPEVRPNLYLIDGVETFACSKCANGAIRVFRVPSSNLGTLQTKFDRLGKRAKKLGLPAPTFSLLREERIVKKNPITDQVIKAYLLHYLTVDAGASVVKVNGWQFIATIDHTEEGNILRCVGDQKIPAQYRECSQYCDHCQTSRRRNNTYLLRYEDGITHKLVGRNCLRDFFGTDAIVFAERAELLYDVLATGEACEDEMGFGGNGPSYEVLEIYLAYVSECIKCEGWMSRSRCRALGFGISTADLAMTHLHPPKPPIKFEPLFSQPSEAAVKEAEAAIEWAQALEGEEISEYLHNIRVIARRGLIGPKDAGLSASIVSSYQRHLGNLRQKELRARQAEISQYVGSVGERRVFRNLYVDKVLSFEGQFGVSSLHILSDPAGNALAYWGHGKTFETGKEITIKATVKKQEEYKGMKQTTLSRCEEVEIKKWITIVGTKIIRVEAESEAAAKKLIRAEAGVSKLPKGTIVVEEVQEMISSEPEAFAVAV
jgi:hypothetical protein